jgi:hypothetical protein
MQDAAALTPSVDFSLLWLIPALPLLGAAVNGMFGLHLSRRFGPRINHLIAIALPTASFVIATVGFFLLRHQIHLHETSHGSEGALALSQNLFPFIHVGLLDADLAFWLDPLSAVMALVVTGVGTLIHVYSIGYMAGDDGYWRFFAYLNLFMAAMLTLVLGDNFLVMFIGWEGVGLCSYLLIAFWYRDKANAIAGNKAFIVNRVGDFGFVLGMALLFWALMGNHTGSMFMGANQRGAATFATDGYRTGYYGAHRVTDLESHELCAQYGGSPEFCTFASLDDETTAVPARGSLAETTKPPQCPPAAVSPSASARPARRPPRACASTRCAPACTRTTHSGPKTVPAPKPSWGCRSSCSSACCSSWVQPARAPRSPCTCGYPTPWPDPHPCRRSSTPPPWSPPVSTWWPAAAFFSRSRPRR